ncbi:MAG: Uma2 family endonuclease [Cyanobacteria bacterium J069]|nr:MAG: Uma2 family endonuclease [Cyanobacteria bacterium J069]
MRLETMEGGAVHASAYSILLLTLALWCCAKEVAVVGLVNCSYRKAGVREAQLDISYYVGDRAALAPQGRTIANLDDTPPPDLAIEIADSSLADDLGTKRLLYEELNVAEYWVVDVATCQIIAFQIADQGSRRITISQVLLGLALPLLQEALELSKQFDDSQVGLTQLGDFSRAQPAKNHPESIQLVSTA